MAYRIWLYYILSLTVVSTHGYTVTPTPDWAKLNDAYWDSFFSQQFVHQLSGTDDTLYGPMGTVTTLNYPSSFTCTDLSTTFSATVALPNYHRIVVFYRGTRYNVNGNCSALITIGDNYPLCLTGSAVNESAALQTVQHSTNDLPITFTLNFTDLAVVGASLPGYKFYYLLYNRMLPLSDPLADLSIPVRIPTTIASEKTFPYNMSRTGPHDFTDIDINVLAYDSINVTLLVSDVGSAGCDNVYLQVGPDTKLCGGKTQATVDVRRMHFIGAIYNYSLTSPAHNVGMLIQIIGNRPAPDQRDICYNNELAEASQGAIFSPYYPFNNSRVFTSCHIAVDTRFQLIDYNISWTGNISAGGNCSMGSLQLNDTVICAGASAVHRTDAIIYKELTLGYQQFIPMPVPGFIFEYHAWDFTDIHSIHNQQITTLPFRLMSPKFPQAYPKDSQSFVFVNISGLTQLTINFKVFDLENSPNCEHDYLQINLQERLCGNALQGQKIEQEVDGIFPILFESNLDRQGHGFAVEFTSKQFQPSTTTSTSTTASTTESTIRASTPSGSAKSTPTPTSASGGNKPTASMKTTAKQQSSKPTKPPKEATADAATSKATPGYVWALVVIAVIAILGVVGGAGFIYMRRRNQHTLLLEGNDSADAGFENPIYGERRESEMVRLSNARSN